MTIPQHDGVEVKITYNNEGNPIKVESEVGTKFIGTGEFVNTILQKIEDFTGVDTSEEQSINQYYDDENSGLL